ncbi:hypothetical protein [Streptomyces cucumeris]|uniref:hypothetical protein n=1 Tax=Streptomyces cucumeris TaxID=2962890 RepID=UPI0020C90E59|nr:hypothetical protein [Streptomyces sp. NEAU-Y11]MCP9210484.1 hypothetical protein [Streptomyces sp. NEAU-Y11]
MPPLAGRGRRSVKPRQWRRWVELMLEALDVACLPGGSECGLAFVGCVDFGSRYAMGNSQSLEGPSSRITIKKRGWGEAVPGDD